jgi:hypothetical protein
VIDFVAVLLGYAISGERTLETFYERVQPFANVLMALFGRDRLPARSTLSRFLAALEQTPVEALRTLFLEDLVARPLEKEEHAGGLWDRQGTHWLVFDVDGTRQAARQRALPCTPDLPPAGRRLDEVCAPGYLGRKRGEIVRTRKREAHWLSSCSIWEKGPVLALLRSHSSRLDTWPKGVRASAVRGFLFVLLLSSPPREKPIRCKGTPVSQSYT